MNEIQKKVLDILMGLKGAKHFAPMYEGDVDKVMMPIHTLVEYTDNVLLMQEGQRRVPKEVKEKVANKIISHFISETLTEINGKIVEKLLKDIVDIMEGYNI